VKGRHSAERRGGGVGSAARCSRPENTASLRLHQVAGFRAVGRRERVARVPYGPLAGHWRDTVLLERRSAAAGT
jgi:phosphinothricin acetyltransferase